MSALGPKPTRTLAAFEEFFKKEINAASSEAPVDPRQALLELFHRSAADVPAYGAFLREHALEPGSIRTLKDFASVPVMTKENYHRRHALSALCRDGKLDGCDMLAVSSGSTGDPALWPRCVSDEFGTALRFEQVLADAFAAGKRTTLAVVCFALGSWVGGMYTAACCRHLAAKGYPLTLVTPGNQKVEILRALRALASSFDQIVLFGYPPFLKDLIDSGHADGFDWRRHAFRVVMAGEVFSESWRSLVCERLGAGDPAYSSASLYGTADGGVLANETPLSIRIRRALAENPVAARQLFGEARLPTLCQYDPSHRYFEVEADGSLLFSGDGGIPLLRYKILDRGGIVSFARMHEFLRDHDIALPTTEPVRPLPFVFVFGRSSFALSFYGANVFPENIAVGIEQPEFAEFLSGKFVMEIAHDADQNPRLAVAVELLPSAEPNDSLAASVAASIRRALERLNSEFANYPPTDRRTPAVSLLPQGHPIYFPAGVKHRYTRQ